MVKAFFFIFGLLFVLIVPAHMGVKNSRPKDLSLKQEVDLILVNTARNIRRESPSEMINGLFAKALAEIKYLRKTNARQNKFEEVYIDQVVLALNETPNHCDALTSSGAKVLVELLTKVCR